MARRITAALLAAGYTFATMIGPETFKTTMRQLASGVLVVTTRLHDRPHAMTATAFIPLSAEPPLVLLSVRSGSDTQRALEQTPQFGVNALSRSQADLSRRFASRRPDRYEFGDLATFTRPSGVLFFDGCVAHIEAETISSTPAGDHTVFIAKILWSQGRPESTPLVYHQGDHHGLESIQEDSDVVAPQVRKHA